MKLSVIITTYNSPVWLEKVLWGYSVQTHKDFEIVIGDDGSRDDTRETIDRLRKETGLTIKHIWQEDKGFRKCRILNKAILQADAPYLVFTDGDCIPSGFSSCPRQRSITWPLSFRRLPQAANVDQRSHQQGGYSVRALFRSCLAERAWAEVKLQEQQADSLTPDGQDI